MNDLTQNIEIEFKNLLTEKEFTLLKDFLNIDDSIFVKQDNHYFDTTNFSLKGKGCALRIRYKNGRYELTLKEPLTEGLLETNQRITVEEAKKILKNNVLLDGPVKNKLLQLKIPVEELALFGTLTTERAEKVFHSGLIVLDYSTYLNQSDYEVEYEVNNFQSGKVVFENLLGQLDIPLRKTDNKVRRFYKAKFKDL